MSYQFSNPLSSFITSQSEKKDRPFKSTAISFLPFMGKVAGAKDLTAYLLSLSGPPCSGLASEDEPLRLLGPLPSPVKYRGKLSIHHVSWNYQHINNPPKCNNLSIKKIHRILSKAVLVFRKPTCFVDTEL